MNRGEIWWADLAAPTGRRPVLLLSRNESYTVRELVIVSPLTTQIRDIPTEVRLGPEDGVPRVSVVNLDVINTISKASLQEWITALTVSKMQEVDQAIHFALGLEIT